MQNLNPLTKWFFFILAVIWLFAGLVLTFTLVYITHNLVSLISSVFATPPTGVLYLLYHYHFPPSAEDYELKKLKILVNGGKMHRKQGAEKRPAKKSSEQQVKPYFLSGIIPCVRPEQVSSSKTLHSWGVQAG